MAIASGDAITVPAGLQTLTMCSLAPHDFANSAARCTARADVWLPSLPTTIDLNIGVAPFRTRSRRHPDGRRRGGLDAELLEQGEAFRVRCLVLWKAAEFGDDRHRLERQRHLVHGPGSTGDGQALVDRRPRVVEPVDGGKAVGAHAV